jgi:hypothetical protein
MPKNAGKIDIEMQEGSSNLTPFGGLCLIIKLFYKMRLDKIIDVCVGGRNGRGAKDSEHVLALVLLNLAGGTSVEGLSFLREKLNLEKFGIRIPSRTACREWLKLFHNPSEDSGRGMGKAFIPEENGFMRGWRDVFAEMFLYAWKLNPLKFLTFDMDDTELKTGILGSLFNYKKNRGFWGLISYCAELGQIVSTRYADGNVPPGWRQMEEFQRLLHMVPREVEVVALRSDTAGYQTEILRFCNENWNKRFKRIYYGISAEINAPFRKAAKAVPEENWKPLKTCKGEHGETIVLQEWAEVVYVPNNLATKKHGPDYRFFAIREKWNGEWKDADKETTPEENPACGRQLFLEGTIQALEEENGRMKKLHLSEFGGGIYKLFGVASNIEDGIDGKPFGLASGEKMDGAAIITWQRKRCGKSEEVNHSLKEELAGGHVPSKYFGASAAWFNAAALAFNLHTILKLNCLLEKHHKSRPRTLRFELYTMAGKVVCHGRRMVLKLWKGDYGGTLFVEALAKLETLPEPNS